MPHDAMFKRITVRPITGALGADVTGVALGDATDEETIEELRQALYRYHVIAIRGQDLTPQSYKAVAARFGPFSPNPVHASMPELDHIIHFVREPDDTGKVIGEDWHMDLAWLPRPPGITMLYGEQVPPVGGDTCFTSLGMAYRALSPRMRELLHGQSALHSGKGVFAINAVHSRLALRSDASSAEESDAVHPVVCMHPVTQEPYLFISSVMRTIMGLSEDESRPIIQYLLALATRPEFNCRVRWEPGTLTMWDNPCVLHTAINDYSGYRRVTYRTTIEGWVPLAASASAAASTRSAQKLVA